MKHAETHPTLDVEGCFACRISHVRMSGSAMPTRQNVQQLNAKEKRLRQGFGCLQTHPPYGWPADED
jgi:hypothetical protein